MRGTPVYAFGAQTVAFPTSWVVVGHAVLFMLTNYGLAACCGCV